MKISIVTPSCNSSRYIGETIQSVVSQAGDFHIEYIIVDNLSTDETPAIVERYQRILADGTFPIACAGVSLKLVSEADRGMYDAIGKGFADATGDVFAWLNADDIYLPGALALVATVFSTYPDVRWMKGITSYMTEQSVVWRTGECLLYSQDWIAAGIYGRDHYFIQQDSVFWRSSLWEEVGGANRELRLAGDYDLWLRFARLAPLVTVRAWVSCFRTVPGQLSQDRAAYMREVRLLSPGDGWLPAQVRFYHSIEKRLPRMLRRVVFRILFGRQNYELIRVERDGSLARHAGEYHQVAAAR